MGKRIGVASTHAHDKGHLPAAPGRLATWMGDEMGSEVRRERRNGGGRRTISKRFKTAMGM